VEDGKRGMEHGATNQTDSTQKLVCIPDTRSKTTTIKPPNKKKYELHVDQLQSAISCAELEKKAVFDLLHADRGELSQLKQEKDDLSRKKYALFEELDSVNKEVGKKGDKVQKLRGSLVYPTEREVEQQIRKLEYQICKNNFKLAEEKRIVSEIDRLNRSKKVLKEYVQLKQETDQLRDQQRSLRDGRERLFHQARGLRQKEDAVRARMRTRNTKLDALKTDIEHFREEKRQLTSTFHHQETQYRVQQKLKREEVKRKVSEERLAKREADLRRQQTDAQQAITEAEPFNREQQLCVRLIAYCRSLNNLSPVESHQPHPSVGHSNLLLLPSSAAERRRSSGFSGCTSTSEGSSRYATPVGCSPSGTPVNGSPPSSLDAWQPGFYRRKNDQVFHAGAATKKKKKQRSERKSSLRKVLAHNPETFQQFLSVGLQPPANVNDVGVVLKLLTDKLDIYQQKQSLQSLAGEEANVGAPSILINSPENNCSSQSNVHISRLNLQLNLNTASLAEEHAHLDIEKHTNNTNVSGQVSANPTVIVTSTTVEPPPAASVDEVFLSTAKDESTAPNKQNVESVDEITKEVFNLEKRSTLVSENCKRAHFEESLCDGIDSLSMCIVPATTSLFDPRDDASLSCKYAAGHKNGHAETLATK